MDYLAEFEEKSFNTTTTLLPTDDLPFDCPSNCNDFAVQEELVRLIICYNLSPCVNFLLP